MATRKRGAAVEFELRQMWGAKEIEAPYLTRRPLSNKETGHIGTTKKEWVRETPLKMQLSGGVW